MFFTTSGLPVDITPVEATKSKVQLVSVVTTSTHFVPAGGILNKGVAVDTVVRVAFTTE